MPQSSVIRSSVIRAVAHFVPSQTVTNFDLAKLMDTSDEWIRERTGIRERHFAAEGTPTSDLAVEAAKKALELAELESAGIDLIVAATLSPDFYFPGIGPIIQQRLSLPNIPALDIRVQCSGLVYGVSVADSFIRAGQARRVLLVCAEVQSPALELCDRGRDMAVLFGDGAGALIIEAQETDYLPSVENRQRGIIDSILGSDGSGAELLSIKVPGTANPGFLRAEDHAAGSWHPKMEGRIVFKHAVSRMCETAEAILARNNLKPADIDLLFPHQANLRINEAVRDKLGLAPHQVVNNIERYGNTTSATIPIALSEAVQEGKLCQGDLVMTLAFGAGFTWGANLIRW